MTKPEVSEIVAEWIQLLDLAHYRIELKFGNLEDEADAQIEITDSYEAAVLRLHENWDKWPTRKLHATIVHELVHIIVHDMREANESIYDVLSHDAKVMLHRRYTYAAERAVEHIAQRFVDVAGMIGEDA